MKLDFDLNSVAITEFGVGRDDGSAQNFVAVPVGADVQAVLREMVQATIVAMREDEDGPAKYEPSEKHGSTEYLYLALDDAMAASVRELHEAVNLNVDSNILADPSKVFCYFSRLTDDKKRHLTALRRATQFKGVLKNRLLRFVSDSLKLIEDRVFKLDTDFDFLIDSKSVHILRPSGFEFAGKLQASILAAVPQNVEAIQKDLGFVEFAAVGAFASEHPRAARYLASIRAQKETKDIDKRALKKLCKDTGVELTESKGKLIVDDDHIMGFLEVLDRRRYELKLVKGSPERFRAASRRKIDG